MSKNKHTDDVILKHVLSLIEESEEELHALGISTQDLINIYSDYQNRQSELTDIAQFISSKMIKAVGVHSVKFRVKEPTHLLKKIIRKRQEYPDRLITPLNYLELINDLIGVRVLHIYKNDWKEIGEYIKGTWELKREPYAYVLKRDESSPIQESFETCGCKILEHPSGYKAVHYVIETKPDKQPYFAEIQLRTLFEEGWSEIDHNIRYPDHNNSKLLDFLLLLLNKLTTRADEMATHMRTLTKKLGQQNKEKISAEELRSYISQMPIREDEKQQLSDWIAKIKRPD
jgi:putative GTP pyrophosphokinase